MSNLDRALDQLRDLLLTLNPVGPDGFEGLVATALADATGLVIRLAKSGSQFGRDASSSSALFDVAMEAKRYDDNLRLEVLAGKVVVGGHVLSGKVDLWLLGATSEVGDHTVGLLSDILENYGVTLRVLDWTPRPLPPLAVLLASTRRATLAWMLKHTSERPAVVEAILDEIADAPSFRQQADKQQQSLASAEVGLDALQRHTAEWLRARFRDRVASQNAFGQFITVSDPSAPALPRSVAAKTLGDAMVVDPQDITVVALLGGEGVGKTWLVAQWWAALSEPPILILVAGRRASVLDPSNPIESLAKLLAQQQGRSDESAIAGWRRRLTRWRDERAEGRLRFVVVLDGLNEHGGKPWADIIKSLVPEVHALGGLVLVTAREVFWRRDVLPRIRGSLNVREVPIAGYTDEELAAILARIHVAPADIPPKVREFIRNPRACAVALALLRRLTLQPNELTIPRLLLEYWRWRMEERGDLVGHNIQDFEKLLRSHARAWLDHPGQSFDRDEWTAHSGAVQRGNRHDINNDLTEIEEGRFLRIAADNSGAYEFREETLPFSLALLFVHELRAGLRSPGAHADELVDAILEEIGGFDIVAQIVASAVGLACIDDSFPSVGCQALIRAWLGLQNVDDETFENMTAYIPSRPTAFLDAAELPEGRIRRADRRQSLIGLLVHRRDHPRMRPALDARLPRWLGRWSRQSQIVAEGEEQVRRERARAERIAQSLAELSMEERKLFDEVCVEVEDLAAMQLDHAAAMLMAARPQAHVASGLVGWAFARSIAPDLRSATDELAWVVRFNSVDHELTETAVRRLVESIDSKASERACRAAAIALDLLGTRLTASLADTLVARGKPEKWRRVATFCDTNPHDPDAAPGSNLDRAREVAAGIPALAVWNHMGATTDDHNLEQVTPALARFDPTAIVSALRNIIRTIEHRSDLPFRQLAWRLPEFSPLFDRQTIAAVESAYRRLISEPGIVQSEEFSWIASQLVIALTPHLEPVAQLDLLLSLPAAVPEYFDLRRALRPLPADVLERRLEAALGRTDTPDLRRILFFASASPAALVDRTRQIIAELTNSADARVASLAADAAYIAQDQRLNALLLEQAQRRSSAADDPEEAFWRARAVAAAVVKQVRRDLLHLVAPRFLGYVIVALGDQALDRMITYLERALGRLLRRVVTPEPSDARLSISTSKDGLETIKSVDDLGESSQSVDLRSRVDDLANPEAAVRRFAERQRAMAEQIRVFETRLAEEGASALASTPQLNGFAPLVERDPERVLRWLDQILSTTDEAALRQVSNLGIGLAGAYAARDGDKSAAVLRHLWERRPAVRIVIGDERIALYDQALFSAGKSHSLDQLREDVFANAFDDATIEAAVTAAETCGATAWLDDYMGVLIQSKRPSEQARGLTIAGLRCPNAGSERALAEEWGLGFLGRVAAVASEDYRRDRWARHWIDSALSADDQIDFWRFSQLAEGVADWRFNRWLRGEKGGVHILRFGQELYTRLRKASEQRTQKRKATLFGLKAPDRDLIVLLRDAPQR